MAAWKLRSGVSALEMERKPPPGAPLVEEEKLGAGALEPAPPGKVAPPSHLRAEYTNPQEPDLRTCFPHLAQDSAPAPPSHPCPPYLQEPTLPVIPSSHSNGSRSPPPPRVSLCFPLVFNRPPQQSLPTPCSKRLPRLPFPQPHLSRARPLGDCWGSE